MKIMDIEVTESEYFAILDHINLNYGMMWNYLSEKKRVKIIEGVLKDARK